jgi:hypothetical protein
MVLRLPLYLVEYGFYEEVEFVFLIVGHTKNPCDARFNSLKLTFRHSNVYTMAQALGKLNEHWQCDAEEFHDHRDWDKFLDVLYSRFDANTTKKFHNFKVSFDQGPTLMRIGVSLAEEDSNKELTKEFGTTVENRAECLRAEPSLLPKVGVKLIKRMELATKWRQQDESCPIPSEEEQQKHKRQRKQKKKAAEETATGNNIDEEVEEVAEEGRNMTITDNENVVANLALLQQQTTIAQQQMQFI